LRALCESSRAICARRISSRDAAPWSGCWLNPAWTFGVAFVARRAEATISNGVDFGAVGNALGIPGSVPGGSDGGATLTMQARHNVTFNDITFADAHHGWAVGDTYDASTFTFTGAILATSDGGAHWSAQDAGSSSILAAVACTDAGHAWPVGYGSMLLESFVAVMAMIAFSFSASAGYVFNDLLDVEADRMHATKCDRPFASGALPRAFGPPLLISLMALSVVLSWAYLPLTFLIMLGVYFFGTLSYSLYFKRLLMLDVLVLAALYTHRILSGGKPDAANGRLRWHWGVSDPAAKDRVDRLLAVFAAGRRPGSPSRDVLQSTFFVLSFN